MTLAMTPPKGWNSWDAYGASVNEEEVLRNTRIMADKLQKYGWEYIVVDIQWYEPQANSSRYHDFYPLVMDQYSRLLPAENRFPSAQKNLGFKPLADEIHRLGLKFGIHIMRGIPREAVHKNMAIKGTKKTARDIALNNICPWNSDMYGVNVDLPEGQLYYDSLLELLLDLMLPGKHGYQVLAELRSQNVQTPVLILTAKDGLDDKVTGFQKGADDYLTKPFYREELLLRAKALLRRSLGLFDEQQVSTGDLVCQLASRQVFYQDQLLPIQGKEFDLLVYFMQNKGIILTKEQIFDRIWGFDSETTLQVVEVYMSHLRKHLKMVQKESLIHTLRNVGYLFQEDDALES